MAIEATGAGGSAQSAVLDILKSSNNLPGEEDDAEDNLDEDQDTQNENLDNEDEIEDDSSESDEESDDESDDESAEGAVEIDSSTLASLLGIEESLISVDENGNTLFRAKVDGEEKEISFDNLLRNYRLQQHVDNKSSTLTKERETFQKEIETKRSEYDQQIQKTALYMQKQEEAIINEYNSIDWGKFEEADPAKAVLTRDKYRERLNQLQLTRQNLAEEYGKELEKRNEEFAKHREEVFRKHAEKLKEKIPEWENPEVAKAESAQLKNYAKEALGFTDEELSMIAHYGAWIGIRKAMLYDKLQADASETGKQVRKLPRVVVKRTPAEPGKKKRAQVKAKVERAKQTGQTRDQISAVGEILRNS